MKLVFATNNPNKLAEIEKELGADTELLSLSDISCNEELPETSDTLEGNALQKAAHVYQNYGQNCFADDTGLEVEALDGRPGVYSARYAGAEKSAGANMDKLLTDLEGVENRSARFRTVIALIIDGKEHFFEGKVEGMILKEKRGEEGFGYDPLFQPEGYAVSFAEMLLEEKNKISHRGKAVRKLVEYLKRVGS